MLLRKVGVDPVRGRFGLVDDDGRERDARKDDESGEGEIDERDGEAARDPGPPEPADDRVQQQRDQAGDEEEEDDVTHRAGDRPRHDQRRAAARRAESSAGQPASASLQAMQTMVQRRCAAPAAPSGTGRSSRTARSRSSVTNSGRMSSRRPACGCYKLRCLADLNDPTSSVTVPRMPRRRTATRRRPTRAQREALRRRRAPAPARAPAPPLRAADARRDRRASSRSR